MIESTIIFPKAHIYRTKGEREKGESEWEENKGKRERKVANI